MLALAFGSLHAPSQAEAQAPQKEGATAASDAADTENPRSQQQELVLQAAELSNQGHIQEAMAKVEEALAAYRVHFADEKRKIYSIREPAEALLYMAQAANADNGAIAVEFEYGFAWFLHGYLLVEQGRLDEAQVSLSKAIELSPMNSQYQSELGNLYQARKDWPAALAAYQAAQGASELSPEDGKSHDEGRALRGQGFVLIEMGHLDEAEKALKSALELDPADRRAKEELEYVSQLRSKFGDG